MLYRKLWWHFLQKFLLTLLFWGLKMDGRIFGWYLIGRRMREQQGSGCILLENGTGPWTRPKRFNISTLEYNHPILLSFVIRSKVGDIMYRVFFFKYDVANGITIGTISMNSICKGHDLKTSTCMPCGCNKISIWWVMDRVQNPRFLMCLCGCVYPFDTI